MSEEPPWLGTNKLLSAGWSVVMGAESYRVFWDDQARVAVTEWAAGAVCGLAEASAVTTDVKALGRGPVPILVDMRGMASLERPAREHFIGDQGGVSAIALLAGSAVTKMIANFFIGLKRMPIYRSESSPTATPPCPGWMNTDDRQPRQSPDRARRCPAHRTGYEHCLIKRGLLEWPRECL